MIDMILHEAMGLGLCERRRLIELLKVTVLEELAGPGGEPSACARCGGGHVVRKGRDADGSPRWLCRSCGRTFSRKTMGMLAMSKLPPESWVRFVELACRHAPLSECAREVGVSAPTAHFMRLRLCEVMAARTQPFRSGPGVRVEVDGTLLNESLSGLGRRGGEMPREPHRTGHGVRLHGNSHLKVRVVCGANDLGDCFCELSCRGRGTKAAAAAALAGRIAAGSLVSTDAHAAYPDALAALGVAEHRVVPSSEGGLSMVNALHARLKGFLSPFNGVSTRWLPHYLMWFCWEEQVRRSDADRLDVLSEHAAGGRYEHTRRQLASAPRPLFDWWEAA